MVMSGASHLALGPRRRGARLCSRHRSPPRFARREAAARRADGHAGRAVLHLAHSEAAERVMVAPLMLENVRAQYGDMSCSGDVYGVVRRGPDHRTRWAERRGQNQPSPCLRRVVAGFIRWRACTGFSARALVAARHWRVFHSLSSAGAEAALGLSRREGLSRSAACRIAHRLHRSPRPILPQSTTHGAPAMRRPFAMRRVDRSPRERSRVLLARALATGAPYSVGGEPAAHLDPAHKLRLMEFAAAKRRTAARQSSSPCMISRPASPPSAILFSC